MFTKPVLRLCSSHSFWPEPGAQWADPENKRADFQVIFYLSVAIPVAENQEPKRRNQKQSAPILGFFKPISCYPPLFFADSFRFQADKASLHG